MTKEQFKVVCDLFGGQTATSKLLGLTHSRHLRRVVAGESKVPPMWVESLKTQALEKIKKLQRFYES